MLTSELTIFFLMAVFFVGGFILIVAVVTVVLVFYSKKSSKEDLKIWKELSNNLNLHMPDREDFQMVGKYNDIEVEVKNIGRTVSMYSNIEAFHFTSCSAQFPQPLRLSLNLKYPKDNNTKTVAIGHPEFDSCFNATCLDGKILQNLLSFNSSPDRNLLSDILQTKHYIEQSSYSPAVVKVRHKATDPTFRVADDGVFIEYRTEFGRTDQIKQLLDEITYLAKQIYLARTARSEIPNNVLGNT